MKVDVALPGVAIPKIQSEYKEMLGIEESNGKTTLRINPSSLAIMQTCWRKTHYTLIRKLRSSYESPALTYGKGIHKALETFYSAPSGHRVLPQHYEEHVNMISYGNQLGGYEHGDVLLYDMLLAFMNEAEALEPLEPTDKRSLVSGCYLLTKYYLNYINDPWIAAVDDKGPVIERRVEFEIYDSPELCIKVFGTIDAMLVNTQTGEHIVCDHKTTSSPYDFYKRIKPNHQYTAYILGSQAELGYTGDKFMVNALEVKNKPKTNRAAPPQFPRQITTRCDEDYEEFKQTVRAYADMLMEFRTTGQWPIAHADSCSMYGGCTYHDVCTANNVIRENIIRAKFEEQ